MQQSCGLRNITKSPKVSNHEILGAQHLSLNEKGQFFQSSKGKIELSVASGGI